MIDKFSEYMDYYSLKEETREVTSPKSYEVLNKGAGKSSSAGVYEPVQVSVYTFPIWLRPPHRSLGLVFTKFINLVSF